MKKTGKLHIAAYILSLVFFGIFCLDISIFAQSEISNEKVIERYKLMLQRKPKEGSTFDRLYQFYLEGDGLEAMLSDYQAEAEAKPNDANLQLIVGHIQKRLGKDTDAVAAYQRAAELSSNNYYAFFALGKIYVTLRQHENAIRELTKAATLSEQAQDVPPEELTEIYKSLGHAYFRRDKIDEAVKAWQKISELDPNDIFARIELADLFREQELYEQAIEQHQEIIKLKKDDPYRICLSRREIGNIYEAKTEYQNAIESYDEALSLTAPGNWLRKDLQHRIIGIYAADSNWKGLIEYYQVKLEETPNEPELLGLLAAAYIEDQQQEEGIKTYRKGVELAPTDTNLRLNLISALRNAEKYAGAAEEYEAISQQDPDNFGVYRELGELYLHLDDEEKARTTYQRMIDRAPNNAGTHLILAEIYTGHEWMEDAAAQYEKALSITPNNLDYIEYFGEFYFRQGNREKAIETWNRMVAGAKNVAENYDRLARLLDTKAYKTEALAASRKAVELKPEEYRYHEALAKRLMANSKFDDALVEFTEAAKLAPNEFFAEKMNDQRIELFRRQGTLVEKIEEAEAELKASNLPSETVFDHQKRLAKMYLKLGNITYALEVLLKAKELKPDDVIINRWLAKIYEQQGRRDDANTIFTRLIDVDNANAREYYANIARSYLNVMDFEEATEFAKKVVAHSPRNPDGHQLIAEIAKVSGNFDEAIDSLKKAIRLRPEATDIRSELAGTYKLAGKPRQAIAQYWRCWELSTSVSDKLIFIKPLSETYYNLGQRTELEDKLKLMAKTSPSSVAPVIALAELYRMQDDLSKARFQLARALDKKPDNPELLSELVNISLDLGDNQDALSYQEKLVKSDPDTAHQRRLGELLFDAGREQEAIQSWTKLLHAKNQTLEAEIKLATLLIRHGLVDEALLILDRAAEKITGPDAYQPLYQLGAMFVRLNESERALPHFQRILEMPKPDETDANKASASNTANRIGPPNIDIYKFNAAKNLVSTIQNSSSSNSRGRQWSPRDYDQAQSAAVVQIVTFLQQNGKQNELIDKLEAEVANNPRDIQTLEKLAQIYVLLEDTDKSEDITNRLIDASPNDITYKAIRLSREIQKGLDTETFEKYLNNIDGLSEEARLWYIISYVTKLYQEGKKAEAEKFFTDIKNIKFTSINTTYTYVNALVQSGKIDEAEKVIADLTYPPKTSWWQYQQIYQTLTTVYYRDGKIDKALDLSWKLLEDTKPKTSHARNVAPLATSSLSYGGYSPVQARFPTSTKYFNQNRLSYLQETFNRLWIVNQNDLLYAKLRSVLEAAEDTDRIFPSLAMSYCYWWDGQREKAQEIITNLQKEFPTDLTIKLITVFISIQTGQHTASIPLLEDLAEADPKNRRQYYDLMLQIALHHGNTAAVRKMMTSILNSPSGARDIYQFSLKLQEAGLTQFAVAVAKKAMTLSMRERDPNFLVQLSQHLQRLGRGQDAAILAERALRFAHQRDQYGRTMGSYNLQQATTIAHQSKNKNNREAILLEAVSKNPKSFRSQIKLANYYESISQVKKASDAFKAALELRPKDSMTRHRYAQMLQKNGNSVDAVTEYTALIKADPNILGNNYWEVTDLFFSAGKVDILVSMVKDSVIPAIGQSYASNFARNVAQECLRRNNPKASIELYELLIKEQPDYGYLYSSLASAYLAANERDKAIKFVRDNLETLAVPYQQQMVAKIVEIYKGSDEIDGLITEYTTELSENPEKPILIYLLARMKIMAKDLEGADQLTQQLLDMDSVRTEWITSLADAFRGAKDSKREIKLLEESLTRNTTQHSSQIASVYQKLGNAYKKEKEEEKALDAFRKMGALRLTRQYYWEKDSVARIYMQHKMWDEAEVLFTELLNDLSVDRYYRDRAREQLLTIKQKRDGKTETEESSEDIKSMNVGLQRALAQQYTRNNEVKKAIEIYENIYKIMPEDFESRKQLASLYTRQNEHDKATEIWKALLEADPVNTMYKDGLVTSYKNAGNLNTAFELAQSFIDQEPDVGAHYMRIARLYSGDNKNQEAITSYNKAVELMPGNAQVHQQLAKLYLQDDELDQAENAYINAIQYTADPYGRRNIERDLISLYKQQGTLEEKLTAAEENGTITLELQKELASHYKKENKLDEAVASYKRARNMTSDRYERQNISNEMLKLYVKQDKIDSAIEVYETLGQYSYTGMSISYSSSGVTVKFGGDDARNTLINAFNQESKLDSLRNIFEEKLEKDPKNVVFLEMIAEIYRKANDYVKTAEAYQALCEVQPSNVRGFYRAAIAYHKNEQTEDAKTMIEKGKTALANNSRKNDTWFVGSLATICHDNGLFEPTIDLVETITNNNNNKNLTAGSVNEVLLKLLGQSYIATLQYEKAANAYQNLVKIARNDSQRKTAETALHQANLQGNLYEKKIPEQEKNVQENPDDPDAYVVLAKSYEYTDNLEKAVAQYEKLSELQPDKPKWQRTIGDLYQNQRIKTGEVQNTALELDGKDSYFEVGDSETLNNINKQITMTAWIKPTNYPKRYQPIIFKGDNRNSDVSNRSYNLWLRNDGAIQLSSSPKGKQQSFVYSPSGSIMLNEWHHITGVIDSQNDSIKLYINGSEVGQKDYKGEESVHESTLPLRIGSSHEDIRETHATFTGLIDEVSIWNIPLTPEQIQSCMDNKLNGNEPGLVSYWSFDEMSDESISDVSPNSNDGKLMGTSKLTTYARPIFAPPGAEQMEKAAAAYEKAILIKPDNYEMYRLLAQIYIKADDPFKVESVYQRALDAPISQSDQNIVIQDIANLYTDKGLEKNLIPVLEELKPKMAWSAKLHELIGNTYKKLGDSENADLAYADWIKIREEQVSKSGEPADFRMFADELLTNNLFPETALKFAQQAAQNTSSSSYTYLLTLGRAYLVNEEFDKAYGQFKKSIIMVTHRDNQRDMFAWIAQFGKNTEQKDGFEELLKKLIEIETNDITVPMTLKLMLAEFYLTNDKPKQAKDVIKSTGFITEHQWLILGPFDNNGGIGYTTSYIPENTTEIDLKATYKGLNGKVSWKKCDDDLLNGYVSLGEDINWGVAYAYATVSSPDERDVQFKYDGDDQSKVWVNGKQVYTNNSAQAAVMDNNTIPVKLNAGKNTILVKVCEQTGFWGFYLRITDKDGKPYDDLTISEPE